MLGTRAGHERFEQIKAKAADLAQLAAGAGRGGQGRRCGQGERGQAARPGRRRGEQRRRRGRRGPEDRPEPWHAPPVTRATGTREIRIGCEFVHSFGLRRAGHLPGGAGADQPHLQVHDEVWTFSPEQQTRTYHDLYGNPCLRLTIPAGRVRADATRRWSTVPDAAEDADEDAPEILPADAARRRADLHPAQPLLPARHARRRGVGAVRLDCRPATAGCRRSATTCNNHLTFRYGSQRARPRPRTCNASGFGVCRDFTHLAISFCRALNIPARYVFGYLPDMDVPLDPAPMDFAAWMEVWLGDRWWTFDPRNNQRAQGPGPDRPRPGRVRRRDGDHLRRALRWSR